MFLKKNICLSSLIVLVTFLIFYTNVSAQSASIEGTVVDSVNGSSLPGANIILMETSFGTASNNTGKFVIKNIPPGKYTVRTSYVGYKTKEFTISLRANRTLKTVIRLNPASVQGQTVTVISQAVGQNAAINKQLSADQIKNVVSRARIQELPDANAAESVARLPGVSLIRQGGQGTEIVIRGLSPQYNQVTIEGVQLPSNVATIAENSQSTLVGDRAIDLSMISSSILGGLEVIKAITPDMDAAVFGGVVNFTLRKAKVDSAGLPSFELLAQGGYNGLKDSYKDYQIGGTYQQRFFSQHLGLIAQAYLARRNSSSNQLNANYSLNDKLHGDLGIPDLNFVNLQDAYQVYKTKNISAVLDYKHSGGDLFFMNLLSSSNTDPVYRNEQINNTNTIYYNTNEWEEKINVITNLLSVNQEIPYFDVNLKLSHAYSENMSPDIISSSFFQRDAGFSGLRYVSKLSPEAFAALAKPNENFTTFTGMNVTSTFLRDRAFTGSIDLNSDNITLGFITTKIKFGGMLGSEKRSYDYNNDGAVTSSVGGQSLISRILQLNPGMQRYRNSLTITGFIDDSYSFGNFLDGQYNIVYPVNADFIRTIYEMNKLTPVLEAYNYTSKIHDYSGTEKKSAGYIMAKMKIGDLITFLPGIRYQNLKRSYFGYRARQVSLPNTPFIYKNATVTRSDGYWLPMIHLICKPLPGLQIHFAYTNTLNYPDYSNIVPSYTIYLDGTLDYNNYHLKPATSQNYDLIFSFFDNKVGLLTLDGFKKRIKGLIFSSTTFVSDLSQYPDIPNYGKTTYQINTSINSPFPVEDWGIEAEWQTHFWYLPEPFSWIVFNFNYTHTFTNATYPKNVLDYNYDPYGYFTLNVIDAHYEAPLLNAPKDILNSSIGIDYKEFSCRVSLSYTNKIFEKADFWLQNREISDKYFRWDISARQKLPWLGTELMLNLNNITGADNVNLNPRTNFPASINHYGMTAYAGLRVKF